MMRLLLPPPSSMFEHGTGQISDQSEVLLSLPSTTLSSILNQYEVNEYILASDIEGAEADIWFSDVAALQHCQAIVAELEDTPIYTTQDQISKLHSLGFATKYQYGRVFLFKRIY